MGRRFISLGLLVLLAGCGGDTSEPAAEGGESPGAGEFQLGPAGWENGCSVIGSDEVEEATGLSVTAAEETGGCDWIVEPVDENTLGGEAIGWQPFQREQFDNQREAVQAADSDVVIEPITGIGEDAFWQGTEGSEIGEVWVKTDELSFRIVNMFATPEYTGAIRQPMEALAAAIAASLEG